MIIPVRCFSCGRVLADKYEFFLRRAAEEEAKEEAKEGAREGSKGTGDGVNGTTPGFSFALRAKREEKSFSFALRAKREEKSFSFALRAKREEKSQQQPRFAGGPGSAPLTLTPTGRVLDELGLTSICCRRHMLSHVDLIDVI
jgi:DNA-directed RNA polymerase subunit N (RpoN/RPB10)